MIRSSTCHDHRLYQHTERTDCNRDKYKHTKYLDGGFANAKEFVLNFILNDIEHKQLFYDSKTILQEIVQENGTQPVEYILTKEEGPDHNKNFTVEARVNGKVMGQGSGHTKKAAEQAAAYQAIRVLRK